ncbi:hypothetical protein CSB45_07975 [candidate division KSB3 bacterium]|uniref:Glycosyltransferase RgtA/B/C/D-like domain-containing protein n=1 Tax=candidate division KSB3 bacterium TaxID=2044937 RepID=A0A2G6E5U9_9BACT|nr:MAG: hypothetical protein CSB45_07975 [candidate division KSB3 bacterium]
MFSFIKHLLLTPAFSRRRIFWGILGFAFFVRLCAIWLAGESIAERNMSVDASSYHQIAKNVVETGTFTSAVDPPYNHDIPGTFRPPLTPLYLAVFYRILGTKLLWGQIGLAFAGALSCGLTYLLGIHVFDEQSGIIAALISSVYPFFIVLTLVPLTEGLSLFLCLFLLFQLYSSYFSPKTFKQVLGVGCVAGLLLLNKAANITIMPCIVLWGFSPSFTAWKKGLMNVGFVLVFATLMVLPWTIRNYRVTGKAGHSISEITPIRNTIWMP